MVKTFVASGGIHDAFHRLDEKINDFIGSIKGGARILSITDQFFVTNTKEWQENRGYGSPATFREKHGVFTRRVEYEPKA